jgi:LmbE family N-acetylglucosaminyl deacetylase
LEDTPEFRKEIVRLIRTYRPDVVVTADPYRRYIWHRDHRITGQVTLDAVFPYARDHLAYPDLLAEGLKPHKVREVLLWSLSGDINYRSDITDTFDVKLAALRCHKSQVGGNRISERKERLRQRAREMAKGEDFELAEAFHRVEINW